MRAPSIAGYRERLGGVLLTLSLSMKIQMPLLLDKMTRSRKSRVGSAKSLAQPNSRSTGRLHRIEPRPAAWRPL